MSTTQLATPEVEIDKIDVVEGFNSRREFNQEDLARLAETIKADGLVQPVDVRPGEQAGRFNLVAGERRFRAAKLAGLKKIPVIVGKANPRAAAFVENHHRANLNPIETALDLKAYAEEFGLTTHKAIAARAKVNVAWVGDHLRLLSLPEGVQRYVATGEVPVAGEPKLRKIAAVSPAVAELICQVAKRNKISASAFVERFGELLEVAGEVKGGPTMIRVRGFALSDVIADKARRAELAERINATLPSYQQDEDPTVQFGDPEVDAARAAGCLVEYQSERRHYATTFAYITDAEIAADLVERAIERREKEIEARAQAEVEEQARRKVEQTKLREQRKESGEESSQAKAKKRKVIARKFNEGLKRALLQHRTVARRKKYALSRAQAVAVQLIADNPELAGRGLRLVSDQLQDLEVKSLKNGGRREKVVYADKEQSTAELRRRALGTKDPLEVIEVLAEALLAGILADGEEVPGKAHIGWHTPAAQQIEKLLATEIKEVRPRRVRKPY